MVKLKLARKLLLVGALVSGANKLDALNTDDYSKVKNVFGYDNKTFVLWKDGKVDSEKGDLKFSKGRDGKYYSEDGKVMSEKFQTEIKTASDFANRQKDARLVNFFRYQKLNETNTLGLWSNGVWSMGPYGYIFGKDPKGKETVWLYDADNNFVSSAGDVKVSSDLAYLLNKDVQVALNGNVLSSQEKNALTKKFEDAIRGIAPEVPKVAIEIPREGEIPTDALGGRFREKPPIEESPKPAETSKPVSAQPYDDTKILSQINTLNGKVTSLEGKLAGLDNTQTLTEIKSQLKNLGDVVKGYDTKIAELHLPTTQIYDDSKIIAQLDSIKTKLNSLETVAKTPFPGITTQYDDTSLKNSLTSLAQKLDSLQTSVASTSDIESMRTQISKYESKLNELEKTSVEYKTKPTEVKLETEPQKTEDKITEKLSALEAGLVKEEMTYGNFDKSTKESTPERIFEQSIELDRKAATAEKKEPEKIAEAPKPVETEKGGLSFFLQGNSAFGGINGVPTGFTSASGSIGARIQIVKHFELGSLIDIGYAIDRIVESYVGQPTATGRHNEGIIAKTNQIYGALEAEAKIGPIVIGGGVVYSPSITQTTEKIMRDTKVIRQNQSSVPNNEIYGKGYIGFEVPIGNFIVGAVAGIDGRDGLYAGTRLGFKIPLEPNK